MAAISTFNKDNDCAGNILNDNKFFGDIVDTTKEGIEQHKKQEELKDAVDKGRL